MHREHLEKVSFESSHSSHKYVHNIPENHSSSSSDGHRLDVLVEKLGEANGRRLALARHDDAVALQLGSPLVSGSTLASGLGHRRPVPEELVVSIATSLTASLGHQPFTLGAGSLRVQLVAGVVHQYHTRCLLALFDQLSLLALADALEGTGAAAHAVVADAIDRGSSAVVVEHDLATGTGTARADLVASALAREVQPASFTGNWHAAGRVYEHVARLTRTLRVHAVANAIFVEHVVRLAATGRVNWLGCTVGWNVELVTWCAGTYAA